MTRLSYVLLMIACSIGMGVFGVAESSNVRSLMLFVCMATYLASVVLLIRKVINE